jgi:antitoxin component YwqK of YwqJK toxin-antitoxin module
MSVPLPQNRLFSHARWFLVVVLLGVSAAFLFRSRPKATVAVPEVHRQNLELREGRWRVAGQTNDFTGILLDTYEDNKTLKSRSVISNGLLEGLSQGWWSNSVLQVTEYYAQGISHGVRTKYYPNGNKLSVASIVNGKLEGIYERWHENGALAEQVHLTNGVPHGESVAFHPDGSLKARVELNQGTVVKNEFQQLGESKSGDVPLEIAR